MRFTISEGGRTTLNVDREGAEALGYSEAAIQEAEDHAAAIKARDITREKIAQEAGDALSLLGTTSDASTIAVLVGACFMASLDEEADFSAFRAKAVGYMSAISGDHDPIQIAKDFLASLAAGDVRLPALEKGIVEVLAEVTVRGNAVAEAINPANQQD